MKTGLSNRDDVFVTEEGQVDVTGAIQEKIVPILTSNALLHCLNNLLFIMPSQWMPSFCSEK